MNDVSHQKTSYMFSVHMRSFVIVLHICKLNILSQVEKILKVLLKKKKSLAYCIRFQKLFATNLYPKA